MSGSLSNQLSAIERGAVAAWRWRFDKEPTAPLREKGGALDPSAWCIQVARSVQAGEDPPRMFKDVQTPPGAVDAVARAMEAQSVGIADDEEGDGSEIDPALGHDGGQRKRGVIR